MKNFITVVNQKNDGGGVFFGSAEVLLGSPDSRWAQKFTVSKHLEKGKEYEFRAIQKTEAGWNTISDFKCKPELLWSHIGKTTQCVQVKHSNKYGGLWVHIYITKGGLWETVDALLLDLCTVGDIHQSAPKMATYHTWEKANANSWASLAFVVNPKKKSKKTYV